MADGAEKIVRLIVSGRVQGVGFRQWMVGEARSRVLRGWVRNRPDGTVEALVAGTAEAVDAMAAACRTGGPPGAAVASVDALQPDAAMQATLQARTGFEARATSL